VILTCAFLLDRVRHPPRRPKTGGIAQRLRSVFAQGKILCGTPLMGQNACISPADLAAPPIGLDISNSGPLPPGTVLFFGQPDYRNPQSQQASFGIEREIGYRLSVSANYIYVHSSHDASTVGH